MLRKRGKITRFQICEVDLTIEKVKTFHIHLEKSIFYLLS
jgi:hypothetical protein